MTEQWRTLRVVREGEVPPPPMPKPGPNAQMILQSIEELQEARKRNLMRDFDFMEAYPLGDSLYIVVNFKSLGRYEVDLGDLSCTCPDAYHSYPEEGTGLLCKHVLFVGMMVAHKEAP